MFTGRDLKDKVSLLYSFRIREENVKGELWFYLMLQYICLRQIFFIKS